jgi:hypothetical protein
MAQGAPPVRDPAILGFSKKDLNNDDVTTANLDTINISSAGYFALDKDSKNKLVPLIQTSNEAMIVPSEKVKFMPDPSQLLVGYQPMESSLMSLPAASRASSPPRSRAQGRRPSGRVEDDGAVVLVADTDMLTNRLWVQIQPFFGQKLMNALRTTVTSSSTRSTTFRLFRPHLDPRRATSQRPFTTVEDMRCAAEESFRGKEKELQQRPSETERKLTELQSGKSKDQE